MPEIISWDPTLYETRKLVEVMSAVSGNPGQLKCKLCSKAVDFIPYSSKKNPLGGNNGIYIFSTIIIVEQL